MRPVEQFTLESPLPLNEVREILRARFKLDKGYYPWWGRRFPVFYGRLRDDGFTISQALYGMFGYSMTCAVGRFEALDGRTRVCVELGWTRWRMFNLWAGAIGTFLFAVFVAVLQVRFTADMSGKHVAQAVGIITVAIVCLGAGYWYLKAVPASDAARLREKLEVFLLCPLRSAESPTVPPPHPALR